MFSLIFSIKAFGNWEDGIGRQDRLERYQASSGHEFYYDSYDKQLWGAAPLSPYTGKGNFG
jgi:hypothetical protein